MPPEFRLMTYPSSSGEVSNPRMQGRVKFTSMKTNSKSPGHKTNSKSPGHRPSFIARFIEGLGKRKPLRCFG